MSLFAQIFYFIAFLQFFPLIYSYLYDHFKILPPLDIIELLTMPILLTSWALDWLGVPGVTRSSPIAPVDEPTFFGLFLSILIWIGIDLVIAWFLYKAILMFKSS